jgi:outer membrane receptor protein involved in Fe transport
MHALVCSLLATPLAAQTGSLAGTIRDEAGFALPGATVAVLRPDGTTVASTVSGRDGSFTVGGISEGQVIVAVQLAGFRAVREAASTSSGQQLDILLPLAGFTDALTVTASREERTLASVPASVGVIAGHTVERARGVNLAEFLKFVPGVAAGDVSGVDDLRISIRGAGVRAGFGSRGVLLMTDGVPVTEPDGQTPHFDGQIDLANAERVEVVKGPSSAMYGGAALGGVVNVISRAPSRQRRATLRGETGSYEFGKAHAAGSSGVGPFVLVGTFGFTHLDGFRAHNRP